MYYSRDTRTDSQHAETWALLIVLGGLIGFLTLMLWLVLGLVL